MADASAGRSIRSCRRLYVVPIATLVPAMIVWLGLGLASRVIVITLFAVFEILLSA